MSIVAAPTKQPGKALLASAQTSTAIICFFALAFAWSWGIAWAATQLSVPNSTGRFAMMVVSGFGPSLAGFAIVALFSKGSGLRNWIARSLDWRVSWRWFGLAFAIPPVVMSLALAIHMVAGGVIQPISASEHIPLILMNFGFVLLIGGPLGEEFGWRGYAMAALTARVDWRVASLIVGVGWGLWHLPLFFMAGTAQSHMPIPVFLLNIISGSVLFGWLSTQTRQSVLPAILLHTSLNSWAGVLMIVPTAATGQPYAIVTALLVLIALALLMVRSGKLEPSQC